MVNIIMTAISIALVACTYDARFEDCSVHCDGDFECPDGMTCGAEGLCRTTPSEPTQCGTPLGDAADAVRARCYGLAPTCGPDGDDDCCSIATPIPGGAFYRGYDLANDGLYTDMSHPATISPFALDKYEVTVGRFRAFVAAGVGTQASPLAAGAGERTLNGMAAQGGWDIAWNTDLTATNAALKTAVKCSPQSTWTDTADTNENLPMNCLTWYEAMAFCVWDGGHLPTDAEWSYAASGGNEQRTYPWSSPAGALDIDCSYANYQGGAPYCVNSPNGSLSPVGSTSPKGDGKFGQSDLGGNVWELTLDGYTGLYPTPTCDDCANLTTTAQRVTRGGNFVYQAYALRANYRSYASPGGRNFQHGVRCARAAP